MDKLEKEIKLIEVECVADRNAIAETDRKKGMLVYCKDVSIKYELGEGLGNLNWLYVPGK